MASKRFENCDRCMRALREVELPWPDPDEPEYKATHYARVSPLHCPACTPRAPLDPSYAAAVYAVDQLTLAGAGPGDAWHVAQWLVDQHGAAVTRVLSYTLDLWWGVTGVQA